MYNTLHNHLQVHNTPEHEPRGPENEAEAEVQWQWLENQLMKST